MHHPNRGKHLFSMVARMHLPYLAINLIAIWLMNLCATAYFMALFRFGWNATFPTRTMVRPLLFAKDCLAGE